MVEAPTVQPVKAKLSLRASKSGLTLNEATPRLPCIDSHPQKTFTWRKSQCEVSCQPLSTVLAHVQSTGLIQE